MASDDDNMSVVDIEATYLCNVGVISWGEEPVDREKFITQFKIEQQGQIYFNFDDAEVSTLTPDRGYIRDTESCLVPMDGHINIYLYTTDKGRDFLKNFNVTRVGTGYRGTYQKTIFHNVTSEFNPNLIIEHAQDLISKNHLILRTPGYRENTIG